MNDPSMPLCTCVAGSLLRLTVSPGHSCNYGNCNQQQVEQRAKLHSDLEDKCLNLTRND